MLKKLRIIIVLAILISGLGYYYYTCERPVQLPGEDAFSLGLVVADQSEAGDTADLKVSLCNQGQRLLPAPPGGGERVVPGEKQPGRASGVPLPGQRDGSRSVTVANGAAFLPGAASLSLAKRGGAGYNKPI